jgi:AAA15 family ATPase/GTPase
MLVRFSMANFRTFRERAEWSLIASPDKTREAENVVPFPDFNLRLLKSAVVYGANASGKSKLIDGLQFMREFVRDSAKSQPGDAIAVEPFRLSTETERKPSEFEVIFMHQGVRYRYGFEVTTQQVMAEWLYYRPKTKEIEVFSRDEEGFAPLNPKEVKGSLAQYIREGNVRENALALSLINQLYKNPVAQAVLTWFNKLKIVSGLTDEGYRGFSMGRAQEPERKQAMLRLLQEADLGIEDITIKQLDLDQLPPDFPEELKEELRQAMAKRKKAKILADVLTTHSRYDAAQQVRDTVQLSMQQDESAGTLKFFSLTGPVLDVLEEGHVLVMDELDSRLHPNLVVKLVAMFNSHEHNPHNAQLLFNTHDTNLLSVAHFRRDQIWFTEKDRFGAATLFSLAEFQGVRATDNLEANYIRGKYGAIPYLGDFHLLPATAQLALPHENEG